MYARHPINRLRFFLAIFILFVCLAIGCTSPSVRRSAIRWNFDNSHSPESISQSRAMKIASKSSVELSQLMDSLPAPSTEELIGTWYGINKGYGAAVAGIHQDVKVFRAYGSSIKGYNILVEQVEVEELACNGWRPKIDATTCRPKTIGNFVVETCCDATQGREKLLLNYRKASNPKADPSRYLVDELVLVEPGLMLGRARIQLGWLDMPVAYFVLSKENGNSACDEGF